MTSGNASGTGFAPSALASAAVCGLWTRRRLFLKSSSVWIGVFVNSPCVHQAPSAWLLGELGDTGRPALLAELGVQYDFGPLSVRTPV